MVKLYFKGTEKTDVEYYLHSNTLIGKNVFCSEVEALFSETGKQ